MFDKRNLGFAAAATVLLSTTFAGAVAARGLVDDEPWQAAPGSLGTGANMAKDWIHPPPSASP